MLAVETAASSGLLSSPLAVGPLVFFVTLFCFMLRGPWLWAAATGFVLGGAVIVGFLLFYGPGPMLIEDAVKAAATSSAAPKPSFLSVLIDACTTPVGASVVIALLLAAVAVIIIRLYVVPWMEDMSEEVAEAHPTAQRPAAPRMANTAQRSSFGKL